MPHSKEGYLWTKDKGIVHGLETSAVLISGKAIKDYYDVVVIGSGFAGLVAARDIASRWRDARVLLIEGRDRIGGRTWTARALGEEFEMGGTWVHWFQPHVYSELHRYGLQHNLKTSTGTFAPEKTYYKPANGSVTAVPTLETQELLEQVATKFFQVGGMTSRELMPYPHDPFRELALWKMCDHLSVRQRLDQIDAPQHGKDVFETLTGSFGSAPGTDVGFIEALRWYALSGHSMAGVFEAAGVYKIGNGGMTRFAQAIFDDYEGDVMFHTVVTEIEQIDSGVTLMTQDGRVIGCATVVSTIPLNCLSDIYFSPALSPLRQQAIEQGHINKGAKVHFMLADSEPPWFASSNAYGSPSSPWCFAFTDHHIPASNSSPTIGSSVCIAFGYNSHLTDPMASSEIIDSFTNNLRPSANVEAYLTHDWMNDPMAKGTWSCWGPGSMSKYLQELQKPHGRVVFASADWANGWRGFVDGAIEQGVEAANRVLELLGKEIGDGSGV